MEWEGREESQNVEDRRGIGGMVGIGGGVIGVIVVVVGLLLGVDPRQLINMGGGDQAVQQGTADPAEERQAHFAKVIFHDTEVVWTDLFKKMGKTYEKPTLVLFSGRVNSACGEAESAMGPFYCPDDHKVYLDLSFFQDMERKLNAPGEFARAYVIAHEVGHHVQLLLGYADMAKQIRARNKMEASVRLELQADYFAGVWAYHGQKRYNFLDKGDLESALHAAFEIGDDRLQKKARGTVVPDSFTHGSSEERQKWFKRGFDTGSVDGARALFEVPYSELLRQ